MCDPYGYPGCGGCGNCGLCYPQPYNYGCAPYDCGVTKLVRPIADAQEMALYPVRLYTPTSTQAVSAISTLLCGPKPPTNPAWETVLKTSICCSTSIVQIVPLQSGVAPAVTDDGVWIDSLCIYVNPQAVAECPRLADMSVVVTGIAGQTLGEDFIPTTFLNESTKVYVPTSTVCFNTNTIGKATFTFKDSADVPLFYNIKNDPNVDIGTVIKPTAQFTIKVRYC
jgi:hypothetical protein